MAHLRVTPPPIQGLLRQGVANLGSPVLQMASNQTVVTVFYSSALYVVRRLNKNRLDIWTFCLVLLHVINGGFTVARLS